MNSSSKQVFVLDFVKENDFENSSDLAKFLKSQKKDNSRLNPYKFNVFALGMIILEMGISNFSNYLLEMLSQEKINFENWVKEQIIIFVESFKNIKSNREKKIMTQILEILKQCFMLNEITRPDFLDLFWINTKNDLETLQKHIFFDEDFMNIPFFKNDILESEASFEGSENNSQNNINNSTPMETNEDQNNGLLFFQTQKNKKEKIDRNNFEGKQFMSEFTKTEFGDMGNIKKYNKVLEPFHKIEISLLNF